MRFPAQQFTAVTVFVFYRKEKSGGDIRGEIEMQTQGKKLIKQDQAISEEF